MDDILNGPSNAMEMLRFFDNYMQEANALGNPIFTYGDCVTMDNCGFHHQNQGERLLRNMLGTRDITLIFQPPYCPEFNVAEYILVDSKVSTSKVNSESSIACIRLYLNCSSAFETDHTSYYLQFSQPRLHQRCGAAAV